MFYIYKAGVVGAGLMGSGIAQVISFSGIPVVLKDVDEQRVAAGVAAVRKVYEDRQRKGKMTPEQVELKMQLVTGTTTYDAFADVDLAIEVVPEEMPLKKRVFADLGKACPASAILATNTSALSVTEMAQASGRPERVLGLHFFYPAPVMKLVEVIPAKTTSDEVMDAGVSFVESLRKIPVRVKECAGFLVNRLLMPYLMEATMAVQEGAATPEQVDQLAVDFGWPMGPFLLTDTLGIDVCFHAAKVMEEAYGERARVPPLLDRLFRLGRYGRKTGAGFYSYGGDANLAPVLAEIRKGAPPKGKLTVERLLYPMVNEAARCLEEQIASPSDIDIAMLAGTGFPQPKAGLLRWADHEGLDKVVSTLETYAREYGPRFAPAPYLKRLVSQGATGAKSKRGFFEYT